MTRRPRDRKATIVTAAGELFAARGFAGVGIDDIGERVGITGPAIYRHFPSKDAVLDAVVLDTIDAFTVDTATAAGGVQQVVATAATTALDAPARLATYVRERHRLRGDARRRLIELERRVGRCWRTAIRDANPELQPSQIGERHGAVLAGLSAVATRPRSVGRPRLDELVADAMVPVLLVPASGHEPVAVAARPTVAVDDDPSRREAILARAVALFRERGYHGVGIDEIGEAAGITGPSVYFHYERKADILVDAYDRAGARVEAGAVAAVAAATSPADLVRRLAASYFEVACDNVDLIVVTTREGDAVPDEERRRLATRRHEIRSVWVDALAGVRPTLDEGELRSLVVGTFPLLGHLAARDVDAAEAVALATAWLGTDGAVRP